MQESEKLCLKWNDFQENLNSAFGRFRNDNEFSDVTLACEDGTQIETHKVILASSSPFFMEILKRNRRPHPLIYMKGTKAEELVAMVDFLYSGEAKVNQEGLEAFLCLAEELRLKGLSGSSERHNEEYKANTRPEKKRQREPAPILSNPLNIYNPIAKTEFSSMNPVAMVDEETQDLNEQIMSMMTTTEHVMATGNQIRKVCTCNVCGKEGIRANIKTHIEANHIASNLSHACDICGKISKSRNGLRLHKANVCSANLPTQRA